MLIIYFRPVLFLKWISLLDDPDPGVQEQALNVLLHIADKQDDVAMIFTELGSDELLDTLACAMESDIDDVVHQVCCQYC